MCETGVGGGVGNGVGGRGVLTVVGVGVFFGVCVGRGSILG